MAALLCAGFGGVVDDDPIGGVAGVRVQGGEQRRASVPPTICATRKLGAEPG